eukprot:SAG11_NODE_25624_length_356_cov_0.875486_1_plen_27_part_10
MYWARPIVVPRYAVPMVPGYALVVTKL